MNNSLTSSTPPRTRTTVPVLGKTETSSHRLLLFHQHEADRPDGGSRSPSRQPPPNWKSDVSAAHALAEPISRLARSLTPGSAHLETLAALRASNFGPTKKSPNQAFHAFEAVSNCVIRQVGEQEPQAQPIAMEEHRVHGANVDDIDTTMADGARFDRGLGGVLNDPALGQQCVAKSWLSEDPRLPTHTWVPPMNFTIFSGDPSPLAHHPAEDDEIASTRQQPQPVQRKASGTIQRLARRPLEQAAQRGDLRSSSSAVRMDSRSIRRRSLRSGGFAQLVTRSSTDLSRFQARPGSEHELNVSRWSALRSKYRISRPA